MKRYPRFFSVPDMDAYVMLERDTKDFYFKNKGCSEFKFYDIKISSELFDSHLKSKWWQEIPIEEAVLKFNL